MFNPSQIDSLMLLLTMKLMMSGGLQVFIETLKPPAGKTPGLLLDP